MFEFLKKQNEPGKLIITSRGFSGTFFFLSSISNLKKAIVAWRCPHDYKYFPNGIIFFEKHSSKEECYIADEKETKKISLAKTFSRMISKYNSFDLYCIGHWLTLQDVETKYGFNYLKKNNIHLINLIRHPIDRTHSNWHSLRTAFSQGMTKDHKQGFIDTINKHRIWLNDFIKENSISLESIEVITFIGACLNLFGCSIDASYRHYQHIKIESLNNELLLKLLKNFSEGKINLEEKETETIKTIRNSHVAKFYGKEDKQDNMSLSTHEKFASWSPWQQELYRTCILKSKLDNYYRPYAYEFMLDIMQH